MNPLTFARDRLAARKLPRPGAGRDYGLWRAYVTPRDGRLTVMLDRVRYHSFVPMAGTCATCGCATQRDRGEVFCTAGCDRRTIPAGKTGGVWHSETHLPYLNSLSYHPQGEFDDDDPELIAAALQHARRLAAERTAAEAEHHRFYEQVLELGEAWEAAAPPAGYGTGNRHDGGPQFWMALQLPTPHRHDRWWPTPARVAVCRGARRERNDGLFVCDEVESLELTVRPDSACPCDITADRAVIEFLTDHCRKLNDELVLPAAEHRGQQAFESEETRALTLAAAGWNDTA